MPLRIAFDLDGVLADLAGAHARIADRLFPGWRGGGSTFEEPPPREERSLLNLRPPVRAGEDGYDPPEATTGPARRLSRGRGQAVWKEIRATEDFWLTLDPVEPGVVSRIHERTLGGRWEAFFVTQRPATAGDTVQRQTQRWLAAQGFAFPSVIVHTGSRGPLAAALELDFLIDDTVQHCVDVVSESTARPILVEPAPDAATEANAHRLGIEIRRSAGESLDLLDRAAAGGLPSVIRGAKRRLGW